MLKSSETKGADREVRMMRLIGFMSCVSEGGNDGPLDAQGPRVAGRLTRQRFEFAGSGVGMAEAKAIHRTLDAHGIGEVQTGGDGRRTFNVQLPTLNSQ